MFTLLLAVKAFPFSTVVYPGPPEVDEIATEGFIKE